MFTTGWNTILSLNYNKEIPLDFDMNIIKDVISKVENVKYLRVVLDNELCWK